jgi:D-glycero-beta-D-manno-heptose-7-phosphate kinase
MMTRKRLLALLEKIKTIKVLMVGDFFIDQYFFLNRAWSEVSLETNLEAYQVQEVRNSLGAAGSVVTNLRMLGASVEVVGMIGKDANGWVMQQLMDELGIARQNLFVHESIQTPTYIKPMMIEGDGHMHELNRMDIKNRKLTPPELVSRINQAVVDRVAEVDGILVNDQLQEAGCGVATDSLREVLAQAAIQYREKPIWVDSRERSALFRQVGLKMNLSEACRALGVDVEKNPEPEQIARELFSRNNQPVIITLGEKGACYCDQHGWGIQSAPQVTGPVDIVGAGDSFLAAMGCAHCAGANLQEAVLIGNLAASVTIQKIGTTGSANLSELMTAFEQYMS